jgi:hypothetical protein
VAGAGVAVAPDALDDGALDEDEDALESLAAAAPDAAVPPAVAAGVGPWPPLPAIFSEVKSIRAECAADCSW